MGYTAIVLEEKYQNLLKERSSKLQFLDWDVKCHHCTLHMGMPNEQEYYTYNNSFILVADAIGISDKAIALRVEKIVHPLGISICSQNEVPHITLLVNSKDGGKAVDSNNIRNWMPLKEGENKLRLQGKLQYINS